MIFWIIPEKIPYLYLNRLAINFTNLIRTYVIPTCIAIILPRDLPGSCCGNPDEHVQNGMTPRPPKTTNTTKLVKNNEYIRQKLLYDKNDGYHAYDENDKNLCFRSNNSNNSYLAECMYVVEFLFLYIIERSPIVLLLDLPPPPVETGASSVDGKSNSIDNFLKVGFSPTITTETAISLLVTDVSPI